MHTPLVTRKNERKVRTTVIAKHVLRKNMRLLLRDTAALKREIVVTVLYFALLILLNQVPSIPPLIPGHTVNPVLSGNTLTTRSISFSSNSLSSQYSTGKTTIAVAPCTNSTPSALFQDLATNYPTLGSVYYGQPLQWSCVATEQDILDRAAAQSDLLAGIVFNKERPTLFTLHVNQSVVPSSAGGSNFSNSGGVPVNSTGSDWFDSGLIALQHSIQLSVVRVAAAAAAAAAAATAAAATATAAATAATVAAATATTTTPTTATLIQDISFRQEPFHEYRGSTVGFSVGSIAPMYYVIIASISTQSWMKTILLEKEKQLRERLLVSGLPLWLLAVTWMVTFAIKSSVFVVAGTVVAKFLLLKTDTTVVLLLIVLFVTSIVALVVCLSTLFTNAKVGVTTYTFFVMLPGIVFNYVTGVNYVLKGCLYLFSPIAFVCSFQTMFAADAFDQQGIHWSNVNSFVKDTKNGLTVSFGLLMLVVDTCVYLALAIYLNRVVKGNGGRTESCCYCCSRGSNQRDQRDRSKSKYDAASLLEETDPNNSDTVQPPDEIALQNGCGVSIRNLKKYFPSTSGGVEVKAVDGLSLDMYDSQVTALLGHNGAGKTTTMSLLTGMMDVTSGDADIYGYSLSNNVKDIRKMVGICTQHNLLWDELTVMEHLQLFGAIRGTPEHLIDSKAVDLARQVGLGDKINTYAKALSGGMKRKLSVALALIGDPKVVFLDVRLNSSSAHKYVWTLN